MVMQMIWFIIISAVVLLLLIVLAVFFKIAFVRGNLSAVNNLDSPVNRPLVPFKKTVEKGMEFINQQPHKELQIKSFDGLKLYADYYENNSDATIILFHGYRSSGRRDFCCAVEMYYKMGMNVLLVDQRSHGRSEGRLITYGVKERYDVLKWVDFVNKEYNAPKILLGGMSMGATTVLLSAGLDLPSNVKGIIADCGFTSPKDIILKVAKQSFKINAKPIFPIFNAMCRILGKFDMNGVSTANALKENEIPVLLIHGKSDNFVPVEMSQTAFNSMSGDKKYICLVDGADHGFSFLIEPQRVREELEKFIGDCRK